MKKIAIEEHIRPEDINNLRHIEQRLKDMDEANIDMQVLSFGGPGVEELEVSKGEAIAQNFNEAISKLIEKYTKRFVGFATIASKNPNSAASELERAVKKLGLKGTLIRPNFFLDDQKYWEIFEMAESLNIPIYIHPEKLPPNIAEPYLTYPSLDGAMLGFGAFMALQLMRLICSGVFDKYPYLKIIVGHMGEGLPWWIWRIDKNFNQTEMAKRLKKKPSEYLKNNFFITTSGMFSPSALLYTCLTLGADNIMFAVDYPPESNKQAVKFMEETPICDSDKEKIFHINAEKLLKL